MRNYHKIEAWVLASDLVVKVYERTGFFPKEERYGLVSQIRRAAISALANIAEGASRRYKKEYLQLLYVARGSLAEMETLLEVSTRLAFLSRSDLDNIMIPFKKTAKCLYGLIKAVEQEVHGPWSMVHGPIHQEEQYA